MPVGGAAVKPRYIALAAALACLLALGTLVTQAWVNGSTFGPVASGLPNGYTFWAVGYGNAVYIYYTIQLPSGASWISGARFIGLNLTKAPLPTIPAAAAASPVLFTLPNGSLAMVYAAVPSTPSGLGELAIVLQLTILGDNGWGGSVNITSGGVVYGYYANGKYIYLLWAPSLGEMYSNDTFMIYAVNGQLVYREQLPHAYSVLGGLGEEAIILFTNGTLAIVSPGGVEQVGFGLQGGFVPGGSMLYVYNPSNGTLVMFNDTTSLRIAISGSTVWPIYAYGNLYIGDYSGGAFTIYLWNGRLMELSSYRLANVTYARAAYAGGFVYFFPYQVNNLENGTVYAVVLKAATPPTTQTTTTQAVRTIIVTMTSTTTTTVTVPVTTTVTETVTRATTSTVTATSTVAYTSTTTVAYTTTAVSTYLATVTIPVPVSTGPSIGTVVAVAVAIDIVALVALAIILRRR